MAERVDIIVGEGKPRTCELRALPVEGACVRFEDGSECLVERVVYPVGRRIALECKQDKPATKKPKAEPRPEPEPAPEPVEEPKRQGGKRGVIDSKAPFKV